jgi:hypothetical protein
MICTHWQPAYTPSTFAMTSASKPQRKTRCDFGATKDIVLAYLEKHGITEKRDMLKNMGMTNSKLRHALEKLSGLIEYEVSGASTGRMVHYWAKSNPPKVQQRCESYQVYAFIVRHPWSYTADIPVEITLTARQKNMCCLTLEVAGKLTSRVKNGRKQYKAVI